jgi:hypothetical protein
MNESRGTHVRSADLLPQPPMARAMVVGGVVALLGALAWGLIAFYLHREFGLLAWAIGAAIGAAMVKAGAHGTLLAVAAGLLALASIASGKQIAFRLEVHQVTTKIAAELTPEMHAEQTKDAADWVALGAGATDEQVKKFIAEHGYEGNAADFRIEVAPMLAEMAKNQPSLAQWREQMQARFVDHMSFIDFVKEDFHPLDILFVILGIASAYGLINKATMELRVAARQQAREEREAQPPTPAN